MQHLDNAAVKNGIEVFYETRATSLIYDGNRVLGVKALQAGGISRRRGGARLRRI